MKVFEGSRWVSRGWGEKSEPSCWRVVVDASRGVGSKKGRRCYQLTHVRDISTLTWKWKGSRHETTVLGLLCSFGEAIMLRPPSAGSILRAAWVLSLPCQRSPKKGATGGDGLAAKGEESLKTPRGYMLLYKMALGSGRGSQLHVEASMSQRRFGSMRDCMLTK